MHILSVPQLIEAVNYLRKTEARVAVGRWSVLRSLASPRLRSRRAKFLLIRGNYIGSEGPSAVCLRVGGNGQVALTVVIKVISAALPSGITCCQAPRRCAPRVRARDGPELRTPHLDSGDGIRPKTDGLKQAM